MQIIGLYSGKLSNIGPKRASTGIYKQPVAAVHIDKLGIKGDIQADKRFHGGPEKALHQYALNSYEKIIKRYPLLHKKAQPGMMGENLTATIMNDKSVCIGDIYKVGSAILQVSSARIPCWKIDAKFKQPELNEFVRIQQICGWYYRVIESGEITINDSIVLEERCNPEISIDTIMRIIYSKETNIIPIQAINAKGLDPEWKHRLAEKYSLT